MPVPTPQPSPRLDPPADQAPRRRHKLYVGIGSIAPTFSPEIFTRPPISTRTRAIAYTLIALGLLLAGFLVWAAISGHLTVADYTLLALLATGPIWFIALVARSLLRTLHHLLTSPPSRFSGDGANGLSLAPQRAQFSGLRPPERVAAQHVSLEHRLGHRSRARREHEGVGRSRRTRAGPQGRGHRRRSSVMSPTVELERLGAVVRACARSARSPRRRWHARPTSASPACPASNAGSQAPCSQPS
jgi:hypothetical protein